MPILAANSAKTLPESSMKVKGLIWSETQADSRASTNVGALAREAFVRLL